MKNPKNYNHYDLFLIYALKSVLIQVWLPFQTANNLLSGCMHCKLLTEFSVLFCLIHFYLVLIIQTIYWGRGSFDN